MFKRHYVYPTPNEAWLSDIINQIPTNAFINKGRCGIGGTTLEIKDNTRSSIIVVPTISILDSKKHTHSELNIVWGDVTADDIEVALRSEQPIYKFMTTPEGLDKFIRVAKHLEVYERIRQDWFLLLDECHCFVTEEFRENILAPFKYFWEFENKALISATPYQFSDARFLSLDYHEFQIHKPLGKVKIIDCLSPIATLRSVIYRKQECPGPIHIYCNSVTTIATVLAGYEYSDVSIYCANDKDQSNMTKLGELKRFYRSKPLDHNYSKINFYTSRYYEGWDLNSANATVILVTDIHSPHTMVSISKLKQAAGRLRSEPVEVIHLTNHRRVQDTLLNLNSFNSSCLEEACILIDNQKDYVNLSMAKGMKPKEDPRVSKYVDGKTVALPLTINPYKLDQQIYIAYNNQVYNHIGLIADEWRAANYEVEIQHDLSKNENKTTMKRKAKATQLKEDIQAILEYKSRIDDGVIQFINVEDQIKLTNFLAYKAANLVDIQVLSSLNFNVKAVEK